MFKRLQHTLHRALLHLLPAAKQSVEDALHHVEEAAQCLEWLPGGEYHGQTFGEDYDADADADPRADALGELDHAHGRLAELFVGTPQSAAHLTEATAADEDLALARHMAERDVAVAKAMNRKRFGNIRNEQ